MWIKVFSLFLAVQLASFGLWYSVFKPAEAAGTHQVAQASGSEESADSDISETEIGFRGSYLNEAYAMLFVTQKEHVEKVLSHLSSSHVNTVENITLDYRRSAYRGLGGGGKIILGANLGMNLDELTAVLAHEIGHNVDFGYLISTNEEIKSAFKDGNASLFIDDPSVAFYSISWENNFTRKKNQGNLSFLSGYAMTNPQEEFAETYIAYLFHGNRFRALAAVNSDLHKKYVFMRDFVFNKIEFNTGRVPSNLNSRPWDMTKIGYNLDSFLENYDLI